MDEFGNDESTNESGGSIRSKLEAALAEKRELAKELRGFKVTQEIQSKAYKYVTPEDLADVDLAELEKSAKAIEERKAGERETVLRQVFADQGYEADALDAAVAQFLAPKEETAAETSARIGDLGKIHGGYVNTKTDGLTGPDLIFAAVAEKEPKKNR